MALKSTVTLYPPEYGKEPHQPIEVHPNQAAEMKAKDWRTEEEMGITPAEPDTPKNRHKKKKKKALSSPPFTQDPDAEDPPSA